MEEFTCAIYGHPRETSINTVRGIILRKMIGESEQLTSKSNVDLSKLPPCRDNLLPHIYRVNHRLACYKRAHQAMFNHPSPYNDQQGWERLEDGTLEPLWSTGPILPPSLIDIVERTTVETENDADNETEIQEIDYSELFEEDDN